MNTATASATDDPNRPHSGPRSRPRDGTRGDCAAQNGLGAESGRRTSADCGLGPATGGVLQLLFGRAAPFARGQERRRSEAEELDALRPASHWCRANPTRWRSPTRSPLPWESAKVTKTRSRSRRPPTDDAAAGASRLHGLRSHSPRPHPRSIRSGPSRRVGAGSRFRSPDRTHRIPRAQAG